MTKKLVILMLLVIGATAMVGCSGANEDAGTPTIVQPKAGEGGTAGTAGTPGQKGGVAPPGI